MKKIKSIIVWCLSIYSILAGICLNEFTVSNILFVLAGLCIMPPIVKKVTEKITKYNKKVKWIIFIILTLFAYGTCPVTNNVEVNNNVIQEQKIIENYAINDSNLESLEEDKNEDEEQVKKEAENQEKKEEGQVKDEAEVQVNKNVEGKDKKEAEAQVKKQAEEQAKREAEAQVKKQAEEQAKKEAEAQAKKQAEEHAKKEAEAQAKKQAEEQAKKETEAQAKKQSVTVTVPAPEIGSNLVWVPTNGGTKYHSRSTCSNMKNPNQVTKTTAEANGFTPCGRCYK